MKGSRVSSGAATVPRMAAKGVTTQVAVAAGVAAATGAAQLGLGYGLGVVVWPVTPTLDDSVWLGSLGWATWIAASSTVFGAMIAVTLGSGRPARPSGPLRLTLALGAGIGALLTVALVALPARSAVRADALPPQTTAAVYALIGIALGILIAFWAVVSRPVAANLIATSAYLWTLAAIAIVVELTGGRPAATYLTSWQFAPLGDDQRYGTIYWPSALITLFAAFLIGAIAAMPAVRRGDLGVGTALSGAVGPVLVAAAFLLLAPQLTGALGQLQSAYLIAPYAVLAGLAGSALVVSRGQRLAQSARDELHRASPPAASGTAAVPAGQRDDDEPTAELGPRRFGRAPKPREAPAARPREASAAGPREASAAGPREASAAGPREEPTASPRRASAAGPHEEPTARLREASAAGPNQEPTARPREASAAAPHQERTARSREEPATKPARRDRVAARPATPEEVAAKPARPDQASARSAAREAAREAAPAKPSIADRLRRDKGRTQNDVDTAEITSPHKSTVAAPPPSPPIAKINPDDT